MLNQMIQFMDIKSQKAERPRKNGENDSDKDGEGEKRRSKHTNKRGSGRVRESSKEKYATFHTLDICCLTFILVPQAKLQFIQIGFTSIM